MAHVCVKSNQNQPTRKAQFEKKIWLLAWHRSRLCVYCVCALIRGQHKSQNNSRVVSMMLLFFVVFVVSYRFCSAVTLT